MTRLLCVFCGSSRTIEAKYHVAASELGTQMVGRGWGLVYGGGNTGLMGSVARAAKAAGGRVVGVIPDFMRVRELAYHEADEMIAVETMRERKRQMEERASAFVALPGGIGTLEELAEMMTLRYIDATRKPIVLLNQDGFYDDLLKFFERMTRERFKSPGLHALLSVATEVAQIWPLLDAPGVFEPDALWRKPSET